MHSKRLKRLFARGHREEKHVIALLESIGYTVNGPELIKAILKKTGFVQTVDATTGDMQIEMINGFGHIKGHNDGVVEGVIEASKTPHLLEIKTAADAKFKKFKKINNLAKSHPMYYAQTQLYMHHLKLTRCLWYVVNKNDDDIHVERIRYNRGEAEDLLRRGEHILLSTCPPRQPFPKTYFECKWCGAYDVCWKDVPMNKSCRSCEYAEIAHDGKWNCGSPAGRGMIIPIEFQRVGCGEYKALVCKDLTETE
jgi:hypothetical protein